MKWMLAAILSVALVTPALATVDITLTAADDSDAVLIQLAPGATTGTFELKSGLSRATGGAAMFGYDAALKMESSAGAAGVFTITGRVAGPIVATVSGAANANILNAVLGPAPTKDIGYFANSGQLDDTNLPAVFDVLTISATDLKVGDVYTISVTAMSDGSLGASDPNGDLIEAGKLGAVTVTVTPEPASLLLLALGGLFLRRRHA
ncbi:MAG TPA: PEP-CTERM sorting domain-containing protein [Phycisphaerae bacterium]|nr:PEP-CTERM sorting domain-containing protein [Phycisphaerae bacterium]HRY67757.1 PEP-CTERM sorting domain-containing protein [Phycisphaerae bacterium]HSA25209.1 PEP-CTERM sorting domain-containing protein [Phycisphaerae bacterium]